MVAARVVVFAVLVGMVGVGAPAYGAVTVPLTAADMEAANGAKAVGVAAAVLAAAPTAAVARAAYAREVVKEFDKELKSTNADARLNTAILMARLNSLSMDRTLIDMLKNDDAAVRLWAAKGLATLAPVLKVAGSQQAVTSLKDALAVEKDPLVADELRRSLATY